MCLVNCDTFINRSYNHVDFIASAAIVLLAVALLGSMNLFAMGSTATHIFAYTGFGFAAAAFVLHVLKRCLN